MTLQAPDVILLRGRTYTLDREQEGGLFDPSAVGLEPVAISTACWRGHIVQYAVVGDRLVMTSLAVGELSTLGGGPVREGDELLGGRFVVGRTPAGEAWVLEGLEVPVAFTGTARIRDEGGAFLELSVRDGVVQV